MGLQWSLPGLNSLLIVLTFIFILREPPPGLWSNTGWMTSWQSDSTAPDENRWWTWVIPTRMESPQGHMSGNWGHVSWSGQVICMSLRQIGSFIFWLCKARENFWKFLLQFSPETVREWHLFQSSSSHFSMVTETNLPIGNLPFSTPQYHFNISRKRHKYHSAVLLLWRWLFSIRGFLCEVVSPITYY